MASNVVAFNTESKASPKPLNGKVPPRRVPNADVRTREYLTAALKRHLRKISVRVKEVNGRLFTTTDALTESIMGRAKGQKVGPNLAALVK